MFTTKNIFSSTTALLIGVLALLAYGYVSSAPEPVEWTPAPANPPNENTEPPINTGAKFQEREGNLGLKGNLGLNVLKAVTAVWSPKYCDENGKNCWILNTGRVSSTLIPGWPDALVCNKNNYPIVLTHEFTGEGIMTGERYYSAYTVTALFNPDGSYKSGNGEAGDCIDKSITELAESGQAFSYNVSVFEPAIEKYLQFIWHTGAWVVTKANTCEYGDNSHKTRLVTCVEASTGAEVGESSCISAHKPSTAVGPGICNSEGAGGVD